MAYEKNFGEPWLLHDQPAPGDAYNPMLDQADKSERPSVI